MDIFLHDLRQAVRTLAKQPGWTLAVGLTLALGIGATTAIFSLVDAVLLRPLGFPEPHRLTVLWESNERDERRADVAPPTFADWREENSAFLELAALSKAGFVLRGEEPRSVPGMQVTPGFFKVLGTSPALGRAFTHDEEVPGHRPVAIVSHAFWQGRLGGRPDVIDTSIELSDNDYTVVGVLPPAFDLYEKADVFTPLVLTPDQLTEGMRGARYLRVLGRLAEGVSLEQARQSMDALARRLSRDHAHLAGWGVTLVPWHEQLVGSSRLALLVLFGAVALVLLIACANVTHLFLARTMTRHREMAIRSALGAGRGRLLAQLQTESFVVALLGGGLGLLAAAWCVDFLDLVPWPIPRLDEVSVDGRVIAFAALVSLAAGISTGLAPSLSGARPRLAGLREAGSTGGSLRARGALIVAETALALVLLVGAGLLLRSFSALRSVDPGFRAQGTLAAFFSLPASRYGEESQRRAFAEELAARLAGVPEVESAAPATNLPISGTHMTFGFHIPDRPDRGSGPERVAQYHAVGPDYFGTMGIPLLRGRAFGRADRESAPPVAVVNRAMAELFWPGESPIGRRLATHYDNTEREIVGVVGSVRHFGLDSEPRPEMYVPYAQNPWQFFYLVVRGADDGTEGLAPVVRSAVASIDPELPVDGVGGVEERLSASLAPLRFQTLLVGAFGVAALLLTMTGLYGVIAYSFTRRTREVAVRTALGARRADVTWQFLRQGLGLTLLGLALGTPAALGLTRFLDAFLYQVGPRDPVTFSAVLLLLGAVALLACLFPALRAARLEPMAALRRE